jgi:hypothetical protein
MLDLILAVLYLVDAVRFVVRVSRLLLRAASRPRDSLARATRAIRMAPRWWWDH